MGKTTSLILILPAWNQTSKTLIGILFSFYCYLWGCQQIQLVAFWVGHNFFEDGLNIWIQTAFHAWRLADRQYPNLKKLKGFKVPKMVVFLPEKKVFYTDMEKESLLKPKITFLVLRRQICLEVFTFRSQSLNIDRIKFWFILGLCRNREGTGWNKKSGEFLCLQERGAEDSISV